MEKKLPLNNKIYFLIEDGQNKVFHEDDVFFSLVIEDKKYLIEKDSFLYEIKQVLEHFCDKSNYVETTDLDLGFEYFKYQSDFSSKSDVHRFDCYLAFSNDKIAVLFYKRNNQLFCHATVNEWGKCFNTICLESLNEKILANWRKVLEC